MKIVNGLVFQNGAFEKKDIRIRKGFFAELAEEGQLCDIEDETILDASGKYVLPGLVDVHTHGRIGMDFSIITEENLKQILVSYAACGVTSVLATTMTNEPSVVEASMQMLGAYMRKQKDKEKDSSMETAEDRSARLLGIHMEGPFLGKDKKGAHDAKYLRLPDQEWLEKMQRLGNNSIRLVTVDPSLCGVEDLIKYCCRNGIRISLGHTSCDYETAVRAAQAGADHVTHLFNAMAPLGHREPGLVGAALDHGLYTELICDGIHVHPAMVRLMFAAHPEQMVLVSDSIPAAGMPEGMYVSGGVPVRVRDGKAVLEDGTIAGSTISLFEAMVCAINFGIPAVQAVQSATYLPAKSIGMEEVAGSIAPGRKADFLIVNEAWQLENVYLGGRRFL